MGAYSSQVVRGYAEVKSIMAVPKALPAHACRPVQVSTMTTLRAHEPQHGIILLLSSLM